VPQLRRAGDDATRALALFLDRFEEVYRVSHRIRALGIGGWPSRDLFRVATVNSLQAALHPSGLSTMALQPPAQRRELGSLIDGYIDVLAANIERAIDRPLPVDEEAA
jgi:hypothetical protein